MPTACASAATRLPTCLGRWGMLFLMLACVLPLAAVEEDDEGQGGEVVEEGPYFPPTRDIVELRSGRPLHTYVMHEMRDQLAHRVSPQLPQNQTMRWTDIVGITYGDMAGSYYEVGLREMAAGSYEVAATRFQGQVAVGRREWHIAYGLREMGAALELSGQLEEAAKAFGRLADELPEHRFAVDARYRQGMALALAKKFDDATAVAGQLEVLRRDHNDRNAGMRAQAVQAAILAMRGDLDGASALSRRMIFSATRDGDVWFHWGMTWAGMLAKAGRHAEAADEYRRMLKAGAGADPVQIASLRLGHGLALAEAGEADLALTELAYLEALPYGSPEQRLIALARAGRLQWEFGAELLQSPEARRSAYGERLQLMARESLTAAAAATIDHPARAEAQTFLDGLPPLPGAEEAEGAEGAEAPAAAEGAEAPAAIP